MKQMFFLLHASSIIHSGRTDRKQILLSNVHYNFIFHWLNDKCINQQVLQTTWGAAAPQMHISHAIEHTFNYFSGISHEINRNIFLSSKIVSLKRLPFIYCTTTCLKQSRIFTCFDVSHYFCHDISYSNFFHCLLQLPTCFNPKSPSKIKSK